METSVRHGVRIIMRDAKVKKGRTPIVLTVWDTIVFAINLIATE
jgi:hypothetical protein